MRLDWQPPNFGGLVFRYLIFRATGATITPTSDIRQIDVVVANPGLNPALTKIDNSAKPGVTYTYFIIAELRDGPPRTLSGPSNFATFHHPCTRSVA